MIQEKMRFVCWNPNAERIECDFILNSDGSVGRINMFETYEDEPTWIILQFTGLIDKNEKPLFEGDIIGGTFEGDFIQWCDKCCSFELFNTYNGCYACSHDVMWSEIVDSANDKELEIIGNKYQNKELLN